MASPDQAQNSRISMGFRDHANVTAQLQAYAVRGEFSELLSNCRVLLQILGIEATSNESSIFRLRPAILLDFRLDAW